MYIPIGPSKKQLYKIIIALLLFSYLLFLGMYKPKALVTTGAWYNGSFIVVNAERTEASLAKSFTGLGEGEIIFSFYSEAYQQQSGVASPIISVNLYATGPNNYRFPFTCDIGTNTWYVDNNTQYIITTARCPVALYNNNGITSIMFEKNFNVGSAGVKLGSFATFVGSGEDSSAVVNAITTQTQNNTQAINNIRSDLGGINNNLDNVNDNLYDINTSINDSTIDSSSATNLTNNSAFQDANGLDAIIKAPLNFIRSLTSTTCSSITLTIPYIDADVSLPCMSTIYTKALGQQLVNLIALVINGVVLYRYCLKILQIVKDAKNPNKDGLEVLDL